MRRIICFIATVTVLVLLCALTVCAYSVDMYGGIVGLEEGKSYTASRYDIFSDSWGGAVDVDSTTRLDSGIWKIKSDSDEGQVFVPGEESGQISFWDSTTGKAGSVFGSATDSFTPGKWTVNTKGAYTKTVASSMRSETIQTVCIHFNKAKVVTPVEGGDRYAYATPIKGEGNLLQESTVSYGFTPAQIVPANRVVSMSFVAAVIRTGGMAYTSGYSLKDALGSFTFIVKVPEVEEYETYSVTTNVDEYGALKITAPKEMAESEGYVVAFTYAPYAYAPDEIYSGNYDTSNTSYVHLGLNAGINSLELVPSEYPAPVAYDGFGIIGVDPDRTYEIAPVQINSQGTDFSIGEWKEYTYSATAPRDLVGLYAVREAYNGAHSEHTFAYAYGDGEERQNILDMNSAGTHLAVCSDLATYDRELFYHGMWSGAVCSSAALGSHTLFNHAQVNLTAYNSAKKALDNASEADKESAQKTFDAQAVALADGVNNIKYKYAFDREGVIPTSLAKSFKINLECNNSTLETKTLTTKLVAYVADREGKLSTYESKVTQAYSKYFSCTIDFTQFLPEEGWLVAFDIYPNTDNTPDNFVNVDTGGFRYPLKLSNTSYTIEEPEALPVSASKPQGISYENGVITGFNKGFAYQYAQFDINGIGETDWKAVSDGATQLDTDMAGLVAIKFSGDGYSHSGSAHTYIYIPGTKTGTIIHTTPTLNSAGTATLNVVDVINAGAMSDGLKVKFNEAKWTGFSLNNSLALKYGFDPLILGSTSTPISASYATAINNAVASGDDVAIKKARDEAAKVSNGLYFSYAYTPDEIINIADFESFAFSVAMRQGGFTVNGSVQTKVIFKVVNFDDELVDAEVYKNVPYSKSLSAVKITKSDLEGVEGYIVGIVIHPFVLTDGSYLEYKAADNGDYNVYLSKDGYKVNAISPAPQPILSLTEKNGVIKVTNYDENLAYAYSHNGTDWTTFEGDSFNATKASTEYTVKSLGCNMYLESPVSEAVTSPAVTVAGVSVVLDGAVGIKVYMDVDRDTVSDVNLYTTKVNSDYKDAADILEYGEVYRVGGGCTFSSGCEWLDPVTLDVDSGLYVTTVRIPAKDADNISFECDLGGYVKDGSRVCYSNLGGKLTLSDYIAKARELANAGDEEFIKALDVIGALETYVAYADNYFNNGDLEAYTSSYAMTEYTPSRSGSLDGAEFYGTSLILEDRITVRHYFKVDDVDGYDAKYSSDIERGISDGYVYYDITDIAPNDYETPKELIIKNTEGTAYKVTYSVANYINEAVKQGDGRLVSLMNAMSELANAVNSYINPKALYVKYDPYISLEGAQGGLHLYIPTEEGYIDHTYVHTVGTDRNANVWRLSVAYMCDDDLKNPVAITTTNAEWDMALNIAGRPDFVGGWAHGDELMTDIVFTLDGVVTDVTKLTTATEFKKLEIVENSVGYDPLDSVTAVLNHHKEYTVTHAGIRLDQKVEWLGDYNMIHSYLAMMPPAKAYTDAYYTNLTEPKDLDLSTMGTQYVDGATSVTVYGKESGLAFTMTVNEYDIYNAPYMSIADNGGGAYNKMYFTFVKNGSVSKGDVWETFTHYRITNK